jgi:hypothetical protein
MNKSNAERLVAGISHHGYAVFGASFHILRWKGQGMMNKAAGEAAPTWELRANPLWRHGKVIANGEHPQVRFPDGEVRRIEVASHMPLTWLLKQAASEWILDFEDGRLTVDAPNLPDSWTS